eukprot:scaffold3161_cov146-Amphora_coffeaeformis.AAC.1
MFFKFCHGVVPARFQSLVESWRSQVRFPLSCSESPKTGGKLGIGGGSGGPIGDPFSQCTGYPVSVSIWFGLEGGDKILTRMGGESLGRVLPYKVYKV